MGPRKNELGIIDVKSHLAEQAIRFNPKGKTFYFNLPDCAQIQHEGFICPIMAGQRDVDCCCVSILKELEEHDFQQHGNLPFVIYNEDTNTYSTIDGQHRICIALHLGMDIMVDKNISTVTADAARSGPNVITSQDGTIEHSLNPRSYDYYNILIQVLEASKTGTDHFVQEVSTD